MNGITTLLEQPPSSGLVSFQIKGDRSPAEWVQALGGDGIWIRDLADPACLRACTHAFTSSAEIDNLITALARY
mgnify:FL=1